MAADNDSTTAIIDEIYEAPFVPERWPSILQKLARATDGEGGLLVTFDGLRTRGWTGCPVMTPLMEQFIAGGYEKHNVRPQRALAKRHAGFLTDMDVMTIEEMSTDPVYQDILRPAGLGWTAGTVIPAPSGDLIVFDLDRRFDRGPYDQAALNLLDGFRPHLARAGLLAARLHLEQARSATETMGRLGLPAVAVDADGRVVAKNDLLDTLSGQIAIKARDRLHLANARANALFSGSLERMAHSADAVSSIPLPATKEDPPAVLHLLPIRRMAHDIFARTVALVFVTPLAPAAIPQADLLGGLFDLSPAENRVAQAMMGGMSLQDYALNSGVSQETVRKQLRGIFAKTATSRQTELLQLLASTTSLPIRR